MCGLNHQADPQDHPSLCALLHINLRTKSRNDGRGRGGLLVCPFLRDCAQRLHRQNQHACTHRHTCIHTGAQTDMDTHVHTQTHVCIHTQTHIGTQTHKHTYLKTHRHTRKFFHASQGCVPRILTWAEACLRSSARPGTRAPSTLRRDTERAHGRQRLTCGESAGLTPSATDHSCVQLPGCCSQW